MMENSRQQISRRHFLKRVAAIGTVAPFATDFRALASQTSPNERLNLGLIGVGGQGAVNLAAVASENIVAVCDVDLNHASQAKQACPAAAVYQDFRKLLDHRGLDAVVISTPDHMHALPAVRAMQLGLHVYCEQPLAHSVHEARVLQQTAASARTVTQMGGAALRSHYRIVADVIRGGALGKVREVHAWTSAMPRACQPDGSQAVPATLDYNLWLGPAPYRPYDESHCHRLWKYWWEFGGGTLAEYGCLLMELPFYVLGLVSPESVQAQGEKAHDGKNTVPGRLHVDYEFVSSSGTPVRLAWRHGGLKPPVKQFADREAGVVFVGDDGFLYADSEGFEVYPDDRLSQAKLEPAAADSVDRQQEWVAAIKSSRFASCDFQFGGALTEAALLGNIAYRSGGRRLFWDAMRLRFHDDASNANGFLRREYRDGWSL